MLVRVTNEFGSGFTVFVQKAHLDSVKSEYAFMGYSCKVL